MSVLLYGGTFDPPHNGHVHNLQAAARLVQPGRVVVMPAGLPPHKAASATPAALRYEMCCACFAPLAGTPGLPELTVSDWEIRRAAEGVPNYSVDTLRMLAREYPGEELYLTVGSDMLLSFTEWKRWQEILRMAHLVCESREAGDAAALAQAAARLQQAVPGAKQILLAQEPALAMASSEIRAALAAGERCAGLVPPAVAEIIVREGLYRDGRCAGM